jgi:hypothetical protein
MKKKLINMLMTHLNLVVCMYVDFLIYFSYEDFFVCSN